MAQSVDGADEWELSESMVVVLPQKPLNYGNMFILQL